ncbi:MAG TPA: hypothetical protein DD670_04020 [Planctomycetaceae bacterium]|nr:hypothetical protein [Planctomycetaceae bacterium]
MIQVMRSHALWLLVMVVVGPARADNPIRTMHLLDDNGRYLEIAPNPPGSGSGQKTRHTKAGQRYLEWTCGDCESILRDMHQRMDRRHRYANLGPSRIVVETKNQRHYSVVYDDSDEAAFQDTANQLGLEVTVEKRAVMAWVLEPMDGPAPGLQPYRGKPEWPQLKAESRSDAIEHAQRIDEGLCEEAIYYKGDLCYSDGITFDEFARFVEEVNRIPVVNKTGRAGHYSFTLPKDFWKKFVFGNPPTVLEPIGVKVVRSDAEELNVVVVRDKRGDTMDVRPLREVAVEEPPGPTEPIPELLGKWRVTRATCRGEAAPWVFLFGDLCCDGRRLYFVDATGKVPRHLDGFEVWKTTRWGKFYRAIRFEFFGGEWNVAERVLLQVHGNTLTYCGIEDAEGTPYFPMDFSREETARGMYIVFERVDVMSRSPKGWTQQQRPPRCWRRKWIRGRLHFPCGNRCIWGIVSGR